MKDHPLKGRKQSPEHIAKRVAARKANGPWASPTMREALNTPEYRAKQSAATKKKWADGVYANRPGRKWTEEQKAAASAKRKQMWAEGRYDNKKPSTRRAVSKMERSLKPYLEALGYRHTEERDCFIACEDRTRMPDFVDTEGRRVFEFFGNFWHHPDDEQVWIEQYAAKGWDCTVLWEADLQDWLTAHRHLVTEEEHVAAWAVSFPRGAYPTKGNLSLTRD